MAQRGQSGSQHFTSFLGRRQQRPLVGRDQEQTFLRQLLLETERCMQTPPADHVAAIPVTPGATSRLPCVVLKGEPGIGKTRLAEEMSREAQQRGWAIVWSRLYTQESSIPYRLWIEVLRNIVTQDLWHPQQDGQRSASYQAFITLIPEIADLLQMPTAAVVPQKLGQEQIRLWEATLAMLTSICEDTPLLVVLDDLQYTDDSSCELLGYLVRRLVDYPILFLGTCREIDLPPRHPLRALFDSMLRERVISMLQLAALTHAQIGLLVSDVPEPLLQEIQRQAGGNPFFAEELANVVPRLGTSNSSATTKPKRIPLPETITAVLDQRLRRLSHACQLLLSNAAVLGGSFPFSTLYLMEGHEKIALDEDRLFTLIEEALQARVLTEEALGTSIVYHFWHPLLMSHLYEQLSAGKRALLHRRAADVLLHVYAAREAEGAASITQHLVQGGVASSRIVHYATMAGDHSYSLSAFPEAERHYRLVIEHMDAGSNENSGEPLSRACLLEQLGECTRVQGKSEASRHFYEEALAIRSRQAVFASSAEQQQGAQIRSLILSEIGVTWFDVGDNTRASHYYAQSEQYLKAAEVKDGPALATIRLLQSYIRWREGSYEDARRIACEAIVLFEQSLEKSTSEVTIPCSTRLKRLLAGDPVALGRTYALLGMIETTSGQLTDGFDHLNKALAIYEQHHSRHREMATVYCTLSDLHLRKAEHALAQAALQRSLALAERIGDVPLIAVNFANQGLLCARAGNLQEAENWYRRGFALAESVNDPVYMNMLLVSLAYVLQDQDKLAEATTVLCRALHIGRTMHFASCIGLALIGVASLRTIQAMKISGENDALLHEKQRLLRRARSTLQRALVLVGLEKETRIEGQLLLVQVLLLLGELGSALQLALATLEEARRAQLLWLVARVLRSLGIMQALQDQREPSHQYFDVALQQCRDYGMHLDVGRTLQSYAVTLLQHSMPGKTAYQQGLDYLHEARTVFIECNAVIDLLAVIRLLDIYTEPQVRDDERI